MDKRYQVFVSSTYADLKEERQQIIQALMEMDCIPAGMELFPAADEDQFAFIKKIIDDCDYYLLVIGGRYGSLTATGVSYTEQEYEYALSKGLRVIALLHENPDDIPFGKSETDPALRQRLQDFRVKVSKERLVRFWRAAGELPGIVALSLSKTIKTYPARGWVRADRVASEDLLTELNDVRKQNEALISELRDLKAVSRPKLEGLAGLDEQTELSGTYYSSGRGGYTWSAKMTWQEIFFLIGPYLIQNPNAEKVKNIIEDDAFTRSGRSGTSARLDDQVFQTISVQLQALDLVKIVYSKTVGGGMALFWFATPAGEKLTLELRTVKKSAAPKS